MVENTEANIAHTSSRISFDSRVYALPILKKAAYRYLKSFRTEISQEGHFWTCTLTLVGPASADAIERAKWEFQAEVLDQDLRASIARETEPVRNAVLALAFSRTGLQENE
ncbi:MAG: His-Xaa-Ser system protein HxsD [Alphaproteobacteria bacterium]|nr:His-Xaa-Ser system protein HxsD [Alphaproteobacteria bacterium]